LGGPLAGNHDFLVQTLATKVGVWEVYIPNWLFHYLITCTKKDKFLEGFCQVNVKEDAFLSYGIVKCSSLWYIKQSTMQRCTPKRGRIALEGRETEPKLDRKDG
jgi:hypothetical protein